MVTLGDIGLPRRRNPLRGRCSEPFPSAATKALSISKASGRGRRNPFIFPHSLIGEAA